MSDGILVFAEQREGQLLKSAREVLTAGRQLADDGGLTLSAVLVGDEDVSDLTEEVARYGADTIYIAAAAELRYYSGQGYALAVESAQQECQASAMLFPADSMGRDLTPRVAAKLGVGTGSDVTGIEYTSVGIQAKRPVYAGKALVNIRFKKEPAVISVRPNTFAPGEKPGEGEVIPLELDVSGAMSQARISSFDTAESERPELMEAARIVSGGRGVGSPEEFSLIEDLADALDAAVGASRAVVDAGWRPHSEQVGQTGKTVSPALYVACGISGAIQHLAGMRSSKVIVAINKDPEAPIFDVADYGIVGDLFDVIPRLIGELQSAE